MASKMFLYGAYAMPFGALQLNTMVDTMLSTK